MIWIHRKGRPIDPRIDKVDSTDLKVFTVDKRRISVDVATIARSLAQLKVRVAR